MQEKDSQEKALDVNDEEPEAAEGKAAQTKEAVMEDTVVETLLPEGTEKEEPALAVEVAEAQEKKEQEEKNIEMEIGELDGNQGDDGAQWAVDDLSGKDIDVELMRGARKEEAKRARAVVVTRTVGGDVDRREEEPT